MKNRKRYVVKRFMDDGRVAYFASSGLFCTEIQHAQIFTSKIAAILRARKESTGKTIAEVELLDENLINYNAHSFKDFNDYVTRFGEDAEKAMYSYEDIQSAFEAGFHSKTKQVKDIILNEINKQEKSPKDIFEMVADDKLDNVVTMLQDTSPTGKGYQYFWKNEGYKNDK